MSHNIMFGLNKFIYLELYSTRQYVSSFRNFFISIINFKEFIISLTVVNIFFEVNMYYAIWFSLFYGLFSYVFSYIFNLYFCFKLNCA